MSLAPQPSSQIVFSGIRCARDRYNAELQSAASEITSIAKVFKRWGAEVKISQEDATMTDMLRSLECSDIVHAAVHADTRGLSLRDDVLDAEKMKGRLFRCRLLVLSACEVGDIRAPEVFLWEALGQGINVIAAVRPVNDYVCSIFFSQFYSALLPRWRSSGVSIHDAVKEGVSSCRERFGRSAARMKNKEFEVAWEETVNSFVLYGDPSMSLQLR